MPLNDIYKNNKLKVLVREKNQPSIFDHQIREQSILKEKR